MALGTILFLVSTVLLLFSILNPVLDKLRVSPFAAFIVLILGFSATLTPSFEITPECNASVLAIYLLVLAAVVFLRLRYARYAALFSALFGGLLAFGAQTLLWNLIPLEPGLLPGVFAALGATLAGRYRRARLFGGLIAPLIAALIPPIQTLLRFGYLYVQLGGEEFTDMAAVSFIATCLFCAMAEYIRSNLLGYSAQNMRLSYKRR